MKPRLSRSEPEALEEAQRGMDGAEAVSRVGWRRALLVGLLAAWGFVFFQYLRSRGPLGLGAPSAGSGKSSAYFIEFLGLSFLLAVLVLDKVVRHGRGKR